MPWIHSHCYTAMESPLTKNSTEQSRFSNTPKHWFLHRRSNLNTDQNRVCLNQCLRRINSWRNFVFLVLCLAFKCTFSGIQIKTSHMCYERLIRGGSSFPEFNLLFSLWSLHSKTSANSLLVILSKPFSNFFVIHVSYVEQNMPS